MEKRGRGCSCVLNRTLRAGLFYYLTFGQRLRKITKYSGAHVVSDKQRVIMSESLLEIASNLLAFESLRHPDSWRELSEMGTWAVFKGASTLGVSNVCAQA